MKKLPYKLIIAFVVISFLGFLDATYLTVAHYTGANLACIIGNGCDKVTTSEYSVIFGIPLALLGAIYYLTIFILSLLYLDAKKTFILALLAPITFIGFLSSIYFVYLQLFVIKAICTYCMLSAFTSTTLFFLGLPLYGYIIFKKTIRYKAAEKF